MKKTILFTLALLGFLMFSCKEESNYNNYDPILGLWSMEATNFEIMSDSSIWESSIVFSMHYKANDTVEIFNFYEVYIDGQLDYLINDKEYYHFDKLSDSTLSIVDSVGIEDTLTYSITRTGKGTVMTIGGIGGIELIKQ